MSWLQTNNKLDVCREDTLRVIYSLYTFVLYMELFILAKNDWNEASTCVHCSKRTYLHSFRHISIIYMVS